ncbi:ABC transporter ATP-binding protein [Candidatus Peregrinibacteria bacterium]|nr:ABC transporter ATP-binding protein [Candidatus Peregrinibacteria bacterium]
MLKINNLTAGYGNGPDIIKKVTISVKEAEIVCIIGPNGAGKSTILRSIFGITDIREGEIIFFGENLSDTKTENIIKRGICYVPQGRSIFPTMTVKENLEMGGFIRNSQKEIDEGLAFAYSQFPKLFEKRHEVSKNLSGGEQQMLAIGRALMVQPKLLLLDEPSIGLSPKITEEVFEKCLQIKKNGTSILMVEQNANIALAYADRGYVLELGENRFEGKGSELLHNKKIGELYLGK